jgi:hypothetical protein
MKPEENEAAIFRFFDSECQMYMDAIPIICLKFLSAIPGNDQTRF